MSELACTNEIVISAIVPVSKENIASRRTIVYQTLIDPSVARIAGEKNKHKLFNKFLFRLNNPSEIDFVSTEKHYEPYLTVSGKYSIDYYRKCNYTVKVDKDITEVILFNHTFIPEQGSYSTKSEQTIKLEGEERLIRNSKAFLFLNGTGEESKLSEFPSAPCEKNSQELVESFKMREIAPNMDVEAIRKRIVQRPTDIQRIVNESLEIDERTVIYRPIYKVTYKCPRIAKEAYLEVDGITSKIIRQKQNILSAALRAVVTDLKKLFTIQ